MKGRPGARFAGENPCFPMVRGCQVGRLRVLRALITNSIGIMVTRKGPTGDVQKEDDMALVASELRDKTPDQLREQLAELKKEAFNLRFQQATSQLENTSRMRTVRRDVARVNTILNEKAAAAASEA